MRDEAMAEAAAEELMMAAPIERKRAQGSFMYSTATEATPSPPTRARNRTPNCGVIARKMLNAARIPVKIVEIFGLGVPF